MTAHPRGAAFEAYTSRILEDMGYTVLERNFRSRRGEVDIIALKDDIIAFVEVKARRQGAQVSGFSSVTRAKQRRIIATALWYLATKGRKHSDMQPRFDVMSIVTDADGSVLSRDYLEGAFDGEAFY